VDYRERWSVGDRQSGLGAGLREAATGLASLLLPERREWRLHGALEAVLDDELRLAMA
jgi:hypothetical protein